MNASEIRQTFLDFFNSKGHAIVPSAPIVVKNDPTLMFTNAGMNQFKDIFLGNEQAKSPRVADTQKCLRVSGKHNDLEEVGYDTYHHTMFEMLGNWSFGNYFKKEAIEWAWELLTEVYKIDKSRLYVTVFGGDKDDNLAQDQEAFDLWKKLVPESQILFGSKKDNFWEMGDTGPCGPCSEIHADIRSDAERAMLDGSRLVNHDHPEVIEIWNLVFIEFNRQASGQLVKLPASHVDTGMGFERLCAVLQHKKSNYDTDVFQPLIGEIALLAHISYGQNKEKDIALRVIADHLRAVSFTIADGQLPSNTGAGYVIRRILRRAVRYGFTFLSFEEPFVYKLVPALAAMMGHNFPEISSQKELVMKVIHEEEASFLRTLSQGIKRFEIYIKALGESKLIEGQFAFELFDTFGFPIDLTMLMAKENGCTVDMDGFKLRLEEQKNRSRKSAEVAAGDWVVLHESNAKTVFTGYDSLEETVMIYRYRVVESKKGKHYEIVLDKTPFYAESGGQAGDTGSLTNQNETIAVINTLKENNLVIHITNDLPADPAKQFTAVVDAGKRLLTANNHSATHLMHAALRSVLGMHVEQKGSLVDHERLRFDFSHFSKMSPDEIREVETIVNDKIRMNIEARILNDIPIDDAKNMGAMALFGEKYGETVRVVSFNPDYSVELCGGTHVASTGHIGSFRIVSEGAIAAGVRRIEAVTGAQADLFINKQLDQLTQVKDLVGASGDLIKSVQQLLEQNQLLQKQIEHFEQEKIAQMCQDLIAGAEAIQGVNLIIKEIDIKADLLKSLATKVRTAANSLAVMLVSKEDSKVSICIAFSDDLVENMQMDASKIIKAVASEVQGGGGGQKFLATAGGKKPELVQKAIDKFKEIMLSR
ncbi:MAG: alanine--tRNA ligase [Bacteroidales bacterium]|nr:alanine--tRNA ligase [Bacteroidales bacterium]